MSSPGYKQLEADDGSLPRQEKPQLSVQEPPPAYASHPKATVVTKPTAAWVEPPKDYLVLSIVTTMFCFMPLGVVALFKSLEVRSATQRGDHATALTASRSARKFNKLSVIIGIIVFVLVLLLCVASQLSWVIPLAVNGKFGHKDNDNEHYQYGYHHDKY